MFASWLADLRYASRRLLAQPAYAVLAVLTVAAFIPAWRARMTDPAIALREQ